MPAPRHLLLFRFSSLGDVAMTVPVLRLLLQQHPNLQVTVVSTAFVQPLFADIDRLNFYAADLKGRHKGFKGLFQLYKDLKVQYEFDAIADLHNVLRTTILRSFFIFSNKNIAVIDKGRIEKKALTRSSNKVLKPLKSTFQRYADVFLKLGLPVQLETKGGIKRKGNGKRQSESKGLYKIGIAPFAQYERKMYPLEKMKEVLRSLVQHKEVKIFLFGGKNEAHIFQSWEKEFNSITSMAGKMSFAEELKAIADLDVMISMDSANMHLASLYGVPVISIWGATHPYAGFYGWGQSPENAIQVELYCRPCSVFGNKPGVRDDLACMNLISPITVYQKIWEQLTNKEN
jgi:ADP-heptose:LPS heptosyltransferase